MKISSGDKRKVFCFKNFVIKVPFSASLQLFLLGWIANLREASSWRYANKKFNHVESSEVRLKDWYCPVLHCYLFGLILVMQRADIFKAEEIHVWRLFMWDLRARTEVDAYVKDQHPENFGMLEGRLVCVDYAE